MSTAKQHTMPSTNSGLLLTKDDHALLTAYLKGATDKSSFGPGSAAELQSELKRAQVVDGEDFPADVVRINSIVQVKMEGRKDVMEFMLVTPDKADIKQRKISVLAPMGTALLGFRQGQRVQWQVPAGRKTFVIVGVRNE